MGKKKPKMEFRYYQMPAGNYVLALLGEKWEQNYGRDIDYLHFHNYLEIGFCYYGNGSITLGEEELEFQGREFTVIPANYPHTTLSEEGKISKWEYLFVDVDNILHKMDDNRLGADRIIRHINSRALFLSEKEHPLMAENILRIMDIMRKGEEFYIQEAMGILISLLMEIARTNLTLEQDRLYEEKKGRVTNIISRSLDYIADNYMHDIKVTDLAGYSHLSETHFRRVFSAYMHMSPLEYINLVRIRTACEHLKKSDDSIANIAVKCGFTTNSTFNRNFKRLLGVTPAEWRKKPENYEQLLWKFEIQSKKGW